jgi:hypothetical protein
VTATPNPAKTRAPRQKAAKPTVTLDIDVAKVEEAIAHLNTSGGPGKVNMASFASWAVKKMAEDVLHARDAANKAAEPADL